MSLFLKERYKPSNTLHSWLLNFLLLAFSVIASGFSETGLLPPAFLILLLFFFMSIRPSKSLAKFKKYPIEMKLLNLWFLFAFITGVFSSSSMDNFFIGIEKVTLTILIANFIVLILLNRVELVNYIFLGILLAGLIQVFGVLTGVNSDYLDATGRAVGFSSNPNSLGMKMIYASLSVLLFLVLNKSKLIYILISLTLLTIFTSVVFDSGSRKSLLTLGFIILAFVPLYFTKNSNKTNPKSIFYSIVILIVTLTLINTFLSVFIEGTAVSNRIEMGEERGGVEGDIRYIMYLYGVDLFLENPVFGVGFNNFRTHFFTGQYSHSDYIESLSTTGLVGFLMYQSVYVIIIFRSLKLFISTKSRQARLYAGMSIIAITSLKIIGLGIILFYSPSALIILGVFSALTFRLKSNQTRIH